MADPEYDILLGNVRELLKLRQGRDVLWHVLSFCQLYTDIFSGNSSTFYLEGKRAVGLEILQMLEDADPTAYARLLLDKQKEKEASNG